MKRYYWVGSRQSDVENEDVFCGSITKYGTKTRTNISFLKSRDTYSEKEYLDFLINSIRKIISKDNNAKFVFANSLNAYNLPDDIFTYCECLNSFSKLTALNNKFFVRQFLSDACKTPPFLIKIKTVLLDSYFAELLTAIYLTFATVMLYSASQLSFHLLKHDRLLRLMATKNRSSITRLNSSLDTDLGDKIKYLVHSVHLSFLHTSQQPSES